MTTKSAKSEEEKGKNEETPLTLPEPSPVPPAPPKAESKIEPDETVETLTQKYKTLMGHHQKLQQDYTELQRQGTDFQGVSQAITDLSGQIQEHGATLNLLTDIVSAGAEYNEELQGKIKKAREVNEARQKQATLAASTMADIKELTDKAGVGLDDEKLKPAREAFNKGDYSGALKLTTISLITRSTVVEPSSEKAEEKKAVDKDKLKMPTGTPGVSQGIESLSPRQKIQDGLREHREQS